MVLNRVAALVNLGAGYALLTTGYYPNRRYGVLCAKNSEVQGLWGTKIPIREARVYAYTRSTPSVRLHQHIAGATDLLMP